MDTHAKEYFDKLAATILKSLSTVHDVAAFTKNADVLGAYAESVLYQFISRLISPLRLSSGTVISPEDFNSRQDTPQYDLIVWDPNPIPAILAEDRFALVPKNSVLGILEVKKTDYHDGLLRIEHQANEVGHYLPESCQHLYLGVICVRAKASKDGHNKLTELIDKSKAVYLMDLTSDGPIINPAGVYSLVNFLGAVRRAAIQRQAMFDIDYPGALKF